MQLRTIKTCLLENGFLELIVRESTYNKNMEITNKTRKIFNLEPTTCGVEWGMREAEMPALIYIKDHEFFMTTNFDGFKMPSIYSIKNFGNCTRILDRNIEETNYSEALQIIGKNELFAISRVSGLESNFLHDLKMVM